MKLQLNGYFVSDDKNLLSSAAIHRYLAFESYWARGRSLETVKKSIEHSLCFGVYTNDSEQIGFARVITDYATTYYICDLFILPEHRKAGLGKHLMQVIVDHPKLKGLTGLLLTKDAHGLYRKFGFSDAEDVQARFMLKRESEHRD
jgi:GNAT superfamily N-acetyltransferase